MFKEKSPLLKLKLEKEKEKTYYFFNYIYASLFALYDFILDNPFENFWYECFNIILSYLQLIAFIFDKTVSILYISQFINKIKYSFGQFGKKIN